MPAQWVSNVGAWSARVSATLQPMLHTLSQPAQVRQLRRLVLLLLALWGVVALARLGWALLPANEQASSAPPGVINPVSRPGPAPTSTDLDIQRMRDWHLFGEAGAAEPVPIPEQVVANPREGIERDAKETRLALKLRGVLASTNEGLGHAIIEHRSQQEIYAVEDKLPVPGRVHLAKVLPRQVILDNGGTYERLELYDASDLDMPAVGPRPGAAVNVPTRAIDKRGEPQTTALATDYRSRLYQNPQSLAEVVSVSAVRRDGSLVGYRVLPGSDRQQFEQLGFQPGDLVTGVNGIALDNPANTMRLYSAMRSASEVVFELQRNEQPLTLAVSLGAGGNQ